MKRVVLLVVLAAMTVHLSHVAALVPEQVRVDTGLLQGVTGTVHPTVRIFKGVPFAAPPLGENRWRAPQPAAKWDGVFKANAFGPSCTGGGAAGGPARGGSEAAAPQRGLPDREHLDKREQRRRPAPGDGLDLRRWLH